MTMHYNNSLKHFVSKVTYYDSGSKNQRDSSENLVIGSSYQLRLTIFDIFYHLLPSDEQAVL